MREIDAENAEDYLRGTGRIPADARVRIERLTGGVSNCVLRVEPLGATGEDFVLKQARAQLDTPDDWFCTVERIWREVEVLQTCGAVAPPGRTPRVVFEDRENYLFAMTAAPREHRVWKRELLAGRVEPSIATACGQLLASIHAGTWDDPVVASQLGDRTIFDELRLDPYYRATAARNPDTVPYFERLIASVLEHRLCLTHADFSPKNLLVFDGGLMLVDYETGHYGDLAFDLGFFLSHLVLKAFEFTGQHEPYLEMTERFWAAYNAAVEPVIGPHELQALTERGIQNFAGCAWARLDGKSRIDYLADPARREKVRQLCRQVFAERPPTWRDVLAMTRTILATRKRDGAHR